MYTIEEAIGKSQDVLHKNLLGTGIGIQRLTGYLASATGKGLRARLLLICATNENNMIHPDAVKIAAAIEILHLASLVHDDVMDGATTRRGIQTLNDRFDSKTAVIAGDYLLSIAIKTISDIDHKRIDMDNHMPFLPKISRMLMSLARGEYTQYANLGNTEINLLTYFKIISGKTASIFYVSCAIGAILANEETEKVKNLARFGHALGMAFQIIDDIKDYEWNEKEAGKNIESDLKNGVITLPIILTMKKNPEIKFALKEAIKLKKDMQDMVKFVQNNGSIKETSELSRRYMFLCQKNLYDISEYKKNNLIKIIDSIDVANAMPMAGGAN